MDMPAHHNKIICSADLHGNKVQFTKLFKHALHNAASIIISGDITPKDPYLRTVEHQRQFITDFLVPHIRQFHRDNTVNCEIFLIMGNDDFKANYNYLKENEDVVVHCPPYNTVLDKTRHKIHVGSRAVAKIIRNRQPFLTLHGHIHECVSESGTCIETIGKTICINPGNDHRGKDLAVVEIDPYHPLAVRRIIL